MRNLIKKPVFEKGIADWVSELPVVFKQYNNRIHSSTKMKPIDASFESHGKVVFSNLEDKTRKHILKFKLGQLVRTAANKRIFSKGDSTNWSYKFYTITEVIHDTNPSCRLNYLPKIHN